MRYEGEHLLVGQVGHFLVLLSLVSALTAFLAYTFSANKEWGLQQQPWKRLARIAYLTQVVSVIGIFLVLYVIIYNHYFEYKYAHQHSKRSLDMKYLLSCFWEGQEGSFMLWSFWQSVLGLFVIRRATRWEAPVLSVVSLAQVFLASFIVGIYFFDLKVGSNPFVLMRNEFPDAPIFQDPQYLQKYLTDGNGLNVLLQNYWMVIHPPVLFLGFSATLFPFAYAVAGLWKKDYSAWTKPALAWALFAAGVLGLGIMMGAAWAYESLTFGGYWAWDPVENASLVPWLILVAGVHTLLIFRATGHSLKSSFWFLSLTYLFILYSTFLTRTGVLGDTSVHSFTGEGDSLFYHLLLMIATFAGWATVTYTRNVRSLPVEKREESMSSREFWMFVGSLMFFISAAYIIFWTSLPIINKIFGTKLAMGEDPEYLYNRVMVLVAVVLGLLTAVTQYLKYRSTESSYLVKKLILPSAIAAVVAVLAMVAMPLQYDKYGVGYLAAIYVALVAGIYTVIANASYIWVVLKGNFKAAGASLTHAGFGLMIVGILISASNKEVISINKTGIFIPGLKDPKGKDENALENSTLILGVPTQLGKYTVTYLGDSTAPEDEKLYFRVNYEYEDEQGNRRESFRLYPDAFVMKGSEGTNISANPDSKHYWDHDVFTYITSMPNPDAVKDTATFRNNWVRSGDTVFYANGYLVVKDVIMANRKDNPELPLVDSAWLASVQVFGKNGQTFESQPAYFVKDGLPGVKTDTVMAQSLVLQISNVQNDGRVELGVKESGAIMKYITLKAYSFPMINLLWLGTLLMTIGFLFSMWRRLRQQSRV